MDGLVDYADSSSDEGEQEISSTPDLPTSDGSKKVADLLDRLPPPSKTKQVVGQKRKLPVAAPTEESNERRDWEKQLAEQMAREKPNQTGKKRIFAFGSLTQPTKMDVDEEEEEEETAPSAKSAAASVDHSGTASALLKMLPAPRGPSAAKNGTSITKISSLIPHAVSQRSAAQQSMVVEAAEKPKLVDSDEEEDEEAGGTDFFGFNTAKFEPAPTASADMLPTRSFAPQARIYSDAPGPARPTPADAASSSAVDHLGLFAPSSSSRKINDERAQRMIYEKELAPWGATDNLAREAVLNIKDVSVDEQLGPNVHATLLRNLNNKAMAQVAAGALPKVKKDPSDRMAKQKHQITHLARVAVSREEQLLEQWAANKEKKKASAKQYGF